MPRICHVLFSLEIGGMESFVAALSLRQRPDVHIVVTDMLGNLASACQDHGIPVTLIRRHEPNSTAALAGYFQTHAIEIVHSHTQMYHRAARAAHRTGIPVHITTDHGRPLPDPLKLRVLDRIYIPWVDAVVAVSNELHDYLRRKVWLPANKLRTIINGVDTDLYAPTKDTSTRDALRNAWNATPDTLVVGSVGRLADVKEYHTLIRAVANAAAAGAPVVLVLTGDGPQRSALEALAHELSAPVHILGERRDIPDILRAFDLFALSSRSEGTSMAILEAESTGLPVFATPVGGNPHLVHDNSHGRLLPVGDIHAWANALTEAARDRAALSQWGIAARKHAIANFSLDHAVEQYDALYAELLAAKQVRA